MSYPVQTRPAVGDDYEAFVTLSAELGGDDPPMARERWLQLVPSTRVATIGESVVGYCYCEALADFGYVRQISVAPAARRRGIARRLLRDAAELLQRAGVNRWCLNVYPDNTPAIRLYESFGFSPEYRTAAVRLRWQAVDELPGADREVNATTLSVEEEEHFEKAFQLKRGQLASARQKRGRILVGVTSKSGEPLGLAVFDPTFPGASIFVAALSLVAPLLHALRPHALNEHDFLQVVAERDQALTDWLLHVGAELRFVSVHYVGTLPTIPT
jgi:ribosomal protein S18 acetylase RimI-like enzyme